MSDFCYCSLAKILTHCFDTLVPLCGFFIFWDGHLHGLSELVTEPCLNESALQCLLERLSCILEIFMWMICSLISSELRFLVFKGKRLVLFEQVAVG